MLKLFVRAAAAGLALLGGALASTTYITTLTEDPNAGPSVDGIDQVVVSFTTNKTSGLITGADLIDYQIAFYDNGAFVYRDTIIAGGVGQGIGAASRDASSVFFRYDADALTLSQFNHGSLSAAVAGLIYLSNDFVTLESDGIVEIARVVDGMLEALSSTTPWSQSTVVPLPPAAILFAGPLLLAAARRRKKAL